MLLLLFAAAVQTGQLTPAHLTVTPAAQQLFERDWVLMNWALKYFDRDHDVLLSREEAQAAASAFRKVADANQDGRISTDEYRAARASILAGN